MRKLLVIFTLLFLTCTGTVQATNELDGNFLLCDKDREDNPEWIFGLIFDNGTLTEVGIKNYTKVVKFADKEYTLTGDAVIWHFGNTYILYRETLELRGLGGFGSSSKQCEISSFKEIMKKFDEVIVAGKKRRKI